MRSFNDIQLCVQPYVITLYLENNYRPAKVVYAKLPLWEIPTIFYYNIPILGLVLDRITLRIMNSVNH